MSTIIVLCPGFRRDLPLVLIDKLKSAGNLIVEEKPKPLSEIKSLFTPEEKIVAVEPLFCNWRLTRKSIEQIINLRGLCLRSASFDWVYKTDKFPITNVPGTSTEAVAEWAFLMAQNLSRQLPLIIKSGWKQDYCGSELKGKTAGIIGLGNIGGRIAQLCQNYGMNVSYWSQKSRNKKFSYCGLSKLMKTSDYIFPTFAQNSLTRQIITDDLLTNIKQTAFFVSVLRPDAYNHKLMLIMAKRNKIGGYAFEEEGGQTFNKYQGNVLALPCLAWRTKESIQRNMELWVDNIVLAASGRFPNRVNQKVIQ